LINQEIAQRARARTRALSTIRAFWYKPGVGRGYARHAASVRHRW
jgi:hypothetical protein